MLKYAGTIKAYQTKTTGKPGATPVACLPPCSRGFGDAIIAPLFPTFILTYFAYCSLSIRQAHDGDAHFNMAYESRYHDKMRSACSRHIFQTPNTFDNDARRRESHRRRDAASSAICRRHIIAADIPHLGCYQPTVPAGLHAGDHSAPPINEPDGSRPANTCRSLKRLLMPPTHLRRFTT